MMRGVLIMAVALAAALAIAPGASAQTPACPLPSKSMCIGLEKVSERGAAECRRVMYAGALDPEDTCPAMPLGRRVSRRAITAYETSWIHQTLAFQHDLGNDVPFVDAPWLSTHNSFNDPNELPTLSHTDSNQQLGLVDQLRLDMRSLELDVHWIPSPRVTPTPENRGHGLVVCHGQGQYAGCTTERLFSERLDEIVGWLKGHSDQVLMLYIQDEIYEAPGYAEAIALLNARLGDRLHRPTGSGCRNLPISLSRQDILDAGKQVVIVTSCGGLSPVAFAWPGAVRYEARPHSFGKPTACHNDRASTPIPYSTHLVRFYEDSTWLTNTAGPAGLSRADDGLTPETVSAMLRCGVDMLGFDQLLPDDGRLAAAAWSWAPGEPEPDSSECAVMNEDARFETANCRAKRPVACRGAKDGWQVLAVKKKARVAEAGAICAEAGLGFSVPRTASEKEDLATATDGARVLIALTRSDGAWSPLDRR